jgi:hypothetical protein
VAETSGRWPSLAVGEWEPTYDTLHMYSQIVGKVGLALSPELPHWWHVGLHLTARGFTTLPLPYNDRTFDMEFDVLQAHLRIDTCEGDRRTIELGGAVREFYADVMQALHDLDIDVKIWPMPVEIRDPIRFDEDDQHSTYDGAQAQRYWHVARQVEVILNEFRGRFAGKSSPVQLYWGGFDLSVARYSGRPSQPPPEADSITKVSFTAEQSEVGFWPGGTWITGKRVEQPIFFSYTFPAPDGFEDQLVLPDAAHYDADLGEFVLPYEAVRGSEDPARLILDFAQTTYEAGARLQGWPIEQLVWPPPLV